MTKFNVHFNAADMDGKAVLVFIKPESPQRNSRIHAWQVLTGTEGLPEFFHYENHVDVNVTPIHSEPSTPLTPNTVSIAPGQLYQAVSMDGRAFVLRLCPPSLTQSKLSPGQCGVMNAVTPFMELDCHWFVDNRPVVTMPHVDTNMTVSFEYLNHLYFTVAKPPTPGQTYSVKDFSPMTRYVMPARAQTVDVDLTCENGRWAFDFSSSS
jgi:hypothetical protein